MSALHERINHAMFFGKYKDRLYWECECPRKPWGRHGNWKITHRPHCVATEELRLTEIADWRRKYRKTVLYKVLAGVYLTILICGGTLCWLYAFKW